MNLNILIAVLMIGALLSCGIAGAAPPAPEPVEKVVLVHYQDHTGFAREKVTPGGVQAKPTKTPRPTATATVAPTATTTPEPTASPAPEPTATATAVPTQTLIPEPTAQPTPIQSDLYKLKDKRWLQLPVKYYVNASASGLELDLVAHEVIEAFSTWDTATGAALVAFGGATGEVRGLNGRNEVYWGPITQSGVIAMTTIYSTSSGVLEADVKLNSLLPWGIDQDGEGAQYALLDRFDVRDIVAHEAGHVLGLDDLYDTAAVDLTMYGNCHRGEVKKVSLGYGDILGIRVLYGT